MLQITYTVNGKTEIGNFKTEKQALQFLTDLKAEFLKHPFFYMYAKLKEYEFKYKDTYDYAKKKKYTSRIEEIKRQRLMYFKGVEPVKPQLSIQICKNR